MDREWERADTYAIGEAAGEKKTKKGDICTPLFVRDFGAASPIYTIKYATLLTSIT